VCMTKPVDDVVGIMIAGGTVPAAQTRVRAELDHAEGHCHAGESVSMPTSANEGIDVIYCRTLG